MKKLFAFDVDGTLLSHNDSVMKKTRNAINTIKKNGDYAILATGRPAPNFTADICEMAGIEHYAIGMNGAGVYDIQKETIDNLNVISNKNTIRAFEEIKEYNAVFKIHTNTREFICVKSIDKALEEIKDDVTLIAIESFGNAPEIAQKLDNLKMDITWKANGKSWIDGSGGDTNKWKAISKLAGELGVELENVYTFGDSFNDVEMMENCVNSVAMGNSHQEIKDMAVHVIGNNDTPAIHDFVMNVYSK